MLNWAVGTAKCGRDHGIKRKTIQRKLPEQGGQGDSAWVALYRWPETPNKTSKRESLSLLLTGK